jgi:phage terminase large subunit GpA-like protein
MSSPVYAALRQGLRPPERLTPQAWAERHVLIPHSARSQRFDSTTAPWLNGPLAAIADNSYSEVMVCAPVGSGKTTLFEVMLPFIIANDPGDSMVVFQTENDGTEWAETRLKSIFEHCEEIAPLFPRDRHSRRKKAILFPHMFLLIVGANMNSLQSKSIRWGIGDEVWRWAKGLVEEFRRRTHDRWNSRLVLVSQAGVEGDEFHGACVAGQRMELCWRCSCGSENLWRWGDVKWDEQKNADGEMDWKATGESVRMECPACSVVFSDNVQNRRKLSNTSFYRETPAPFVPQKITFHFPAHAVWWIPWRKLVTEWIAANIAKHRGDTEPLKQFLQKRLAEFWKEEESTPWGALTGAGYTKAEYASGQQWPGELMRLLTVDVQRDHFWVVCRAWKADGSSRLLSECRAVTFDGVRALQEQYGVKDAYVLVDAQWMTGPVYDACAKFGWTSLHGHQKSSFNIYQKRNGKMRPTAHFYSSLQTVIAPGGGRARTGYWSNEKIKDALALLRTGKGAAWETPDDASPEYAAQIDSEMKKEVVDKKTHAVSLRWVKIKNDNHFWDCECLQVCGAMMLGVLASSVPVVDPGE